MLAMQQTENCSSCLPNTNKKYTEVSPESNFVEIQYRTHSPENGQGFSWKELFYPTKNIRILLPTQEEGSDEIVHRKISDPGIQALFDFYQHFVE